MALIRTHTIKQGDNGPIYKVKIKDIDVDACTCQQSVMSEDLSTEEMAAASVTLTTVHNSVEYFQVYLNPTQTALLAAGTYVWVIQIDRATPEPVLAQERHFGLIVETQGLT